MWISQERRQHSKKWCQSFGVGKLLHQCSEGMLGYICKDNRKLCVMGCDKIRAQLNFYLWQHIKIRCSQDVIAEGACKIG